MLQGQRRWSSVDAFEWGKLLKKYLKGKSCMKWANGLKIYESKKLLSPWVCVPPSRGNILEYITIIFKDLFP